MSIFENLGLKAYGSWIVKSSKPFAAEDLEQISSCTVRDGDFGLSMCFAMTNGQSFYIKLSNQAAAKSADGQVVDKSQVKLTTLSKPGNDDIVRVDY